MYIAKRFSLRELIRSEVAERSGWVDVPTMDTVLNLSELCRRILDPIAFRYGKAVVITSGWRSARLNKAVGGVDNSQHMTGHAADIRPLQLSDMGQFWTIIQEMINNGIIDPDQVIYYRRRRFIHISWSDNPRRQILIKE